MPPALHQPCGVINSVKMWQPVKPSVDVNLDVLCCGTFAARFELAGSEIIPDEQSWQQPQVVANKTCEACTLLI